MIKAILVLLDSLPMGKSDLEKRARGYYKLPENFKELLQYLKLRYKYR